MQQSTNRFSNPKVNLQASFPQKLFCPLLSQSVRLVCVDPLATYTECAEIYLLTGSRLNDWNINTISGVHDDLFHLLC